MKDKPKKEQNSIDNRSNVKIKNDIHEKMKKISKRNRRPLFEEYDIAIKEYIQRYEEQELLKDCQLDEIMRKYYEKLDKHLSSMIAAEGIRNSTILAGLVRFFSNYYEVDESVLYEQMRKEGLEIFTNKSAPYRSSKNIDE